MSNNGFVFVLRVTNPCKYSSFTSNTDYSLNTLIPDSTIAEISTTVFVSASMTFSAFFDDSSINYSTLDGFTLCGERTYTVSPS